MPQSTPKSSAPIDVRGTNLDPWVLRNLPLLAAAHQRLFGRGAKISDSYHFMRDTPDEGALQTRPRSDTYGQDVDLPTLSDVADYAVTPTKKPKKAPRPNGP